ncbi:plasmid partition protein ParG [Microcoleus sp. herbarium7]|uniref:plasmid partition protein ParG n=1 Tax=Microcoleus sp. herbarium7 TaxID=3055435 RepID=UPI002FCEA1FE
MPEKVPDKANDVFIRVFLSSDVRTRFKVACAQSGAAMSEKARELIEEWVTEWEQQNKPLASSTSSGKGRGKKKQDD